MPIEQSLRQRLANQLSRGDIILFTGAGFSRQALTRTGKPLASVSDLRQQLWPLAFPNQRLDDDEESSLGDIYDCGMRNAGNAVGDLLKELLKVKSDTIPDSYRIWYSMPWRRIYTLNIDDLDEAVQRKFSLPRSIRPLSALKGDLPIDTYDLLSVHLNGRVDDYPDVTFSPRQYGERTARPDPWYQHLVADLLSHPIIFVGTQLDEPPLWQQLELRRTKGQGARELRPGSYLVTPKLGAARRNMLQYFNIQLVEMTQEEFASQVLTPLNSEAALGLHALSDRRAHGSSGKSLLRVAELQTEQDDGTGEFLLGRQPTWADITSGRAVTREFEHTLWDKISVEKSQIILLTGTAGSGKSTTLMKLALGFQAEGKEVRWVNPEADFNFQQIRREIQNSNVEVIAIDDVDVFGHGASHFFQDLIADDDKLAIIGTIRSTRVDLLETIEGELNEIRLLSYAIPHLEDSDIDLLLNALTVAHRLGELRGKTHAEQVATFQNLAGRQLLVAMIQATSNERFEEKIDRECQELGPDGGLIYATTAIATSLRSFLSKDEILLAIGDSTNTALNRIQQLINQKLLVETNGFQIRVRHRVVADRAVDYYRNQGQLREPIKGLLWAIATKSHVQLSRLSRERKLLSRLLNHKFMISITSDKSTPREAYALVEEVLSWDFHYYLQRGSYEVEIGDLNLAKNFLDQARSLAPDDYMVQTEWAYMTLKRAAMNASSAGARDRANEAFQELEDAIERRGSRDPYPYHVLGSQGLSWVRRAVMSKDEKSQLLSRVLSIVKDGIKYHPREQDLVQLQKDLNQEYLMLAVATPSKPPSATE